VTVPSRAAIVEVVLAARRPALRWHLVLAIAIAILAQGSLWLVARCAERAPAARSVATPVNAHVEAELDVDVERAPQPAGSPELRPLRVAQRSPTKSSRPPPPAEAGAIVAQEASGPVDLTADTFVTGTANEYAGGATTSKGVSANAVRTGDLDPGAPRAARGAAPDLSRTVSLEEQSWSCPWPRAADAEQIDEQTVVIRVVVRPDGTAESAEVVVDAGRGFGPAAIACAMRTRFAPAHDREGAPVRSRSPPINVRFTR
jgi:periplasmic protein TonB